MVLDLDEIRRYLTEKGPKKVVNQNFHPFFWLWAKLKGKEDLEFGQLHCYELDERIKEILPNEGQIVLSGTNTVVMMYNDKQRRFERANFDLMTGQPVPNYTFSIEEGELIPTSPLEVISFHGHAPVGKDHIPSLLTADLCRWHAPERKDQAAGFLERLIDISEGVPVIEIGKNQGDTFNRYFSIRKYNLR